MARDPDRYSAGAGAADAPLLCHQPQRGADHGRHQRQGREIDDGPAGLGLQHAGQRRRRGGRGIDDEIVARLHLGALGRRIGGGEQRRAADEGEVPAEADQDVGDEEVGEVDAGQIDERAAELDQRPRRR